MKRLVPKMWQGVDVAKKVAVNVLPLNRPKIHWKLSFWHPILDMIRHVWEVLSYMAKSNYRHLSRFFFAFTTPIYHRVFKALNLINKPSSFFSTSSAFLNLMQTRFQVWCVAWLIKFQSKEIVRDFKSGRLMVNCKKRWHLEIMEHNYWLKA